MGCIAVELNLCLELSWCDIHSEG